MKQREAVSKRLAGAANFMLQAHKSGNPQAVQGAWNAVRPFLAETSGQEPPEQFDPAMWPMIYQVAAANGAHFDTNPDSPASVQAFQYFAKDMTPEQIKRARQIHLGLAPRASSAAIKYKEIMGPDGRTRLVAMNPREVGAQVVGQQGGFSPPATSQQPSMDALIAEANRRIQAGETPDEVDAWLRQAAAQSGYQPSGQPQQAMTTTQGVGAFTSPTEAESAFNVARAKGRAETQAMRAQAPIKTAQAAAEAKAKSKASAAEKARGVRKMLSSTTAQLDRLADAARKLLNSPGLDRITGLSSTIPVLPGSAGANAEAALTTLRSQIGFGVLQNMRMMSPTGGALGQVSEKENQLLQENLAPLAEKQSLDQMKEHLRDVIKYAEDSKARLRGAYMSGYGDVAPLEDKRTEDRQDAGDDVSSLLEKYGVQ